jgi:hypothetical protein
MFQFKRDLFRQYGFRIYLTVIPLAVMFFCCLLVFFVMAFLGYH